MAEGLVDHGARARNWGVWVGITAAGRWSWCEKPTPSAEPASDPRKGPLVAPGR